jgi:hypothetical protein
MDIFNPTDTPKDIAISRAIEQAVEMFILGSHTRADHYFDMAEAFAQSPEELFAPTIQSNKETHVL